MNNEEHFKPSHLEIVQTSNGSTNKDREEDVAASINKKHAASGEAESQENKESD